MVIEWSEIWICIPVLYFLKDLPLVFTGCEVQMTDSDRPASFIIPLEHGHWTHKISTGGQFDVDGLRIVQLAYFCQETSKWYAIGYGLSAWARLFSYSSTGRFRSISCCESRNTVHIYHSESECVSVIGHFLLSADHIRRFCAWNFDVHVKNGRDFLVRNCMWGVKYFLSKFTDRYFLLGAKGDKISIFFSLSRVVPTQHGTLLECIRKLTFQRITSVIFAYMMYTHDDRVY